MNRSALFALVSPIVFVLGCHHPDPQLAYAPRADAPLWVTSVNYSSSATVHYSAAVLNQLRNELLDCGIGIREGFFGQHTSAQPRCIDTQFQWATEYHRSKQALADGVIRLFATFESKNDKASFILVTSHTQDLNTSFQSAELYFVDASTQYSFKEIEAAYQNGTLEKVADLDSPSNPTEYALYAIGQETSPRKVYHLTTFLTDQRARVDAPTLLQALQAKAQVLIDAKDAFYQKAFLLFVREHFRAERAFLRNIATGMMAVADPDVSQIAAIIATEHGIANPSVRNLVTQALANKDPGIRAIAIPAYASIRTGIADDFVIIGLLADPDSNVREAAYRVLDTKITLEDAHVPRFQALMSQPEASIRQNVVRLLGNVISRGANSILIGALADSDSNVRYYAYQILDERTLTNRDLSDLVAVYGNASPSVRRDAVRQVGRISTPEAGNVLIAALADTDSNVRYYAYSLLEPWNLTDVHLPALGKLLSDPSPSVRQNAVRLLAHISSTDASNLLIGALLDKDSTVRYYAYNILEDRALSDQNLFAFQMVLTSTDSSIRQNAVRLLGNILTISATSLLIPNIEDSDSTVRYYAHDVLDKRMFTDAHITQFGGLLVSTLTSARQDAAYFLGKTNSRKAYDLLVARLPLEMDSAVKYQIKSSLDNLKKALGL